MLFRQFYPDRDMGPSFTMHRGWVHLRDGGKVELRHGWLAGTDAATQLTTSAPISLGGLLLPAGTYTLWTVPRVGRVDLIVNRQTGQWGTQYRRAQDLGRVPLQSDTADPPVERFTIAIEPRDARGGTRRSERADGFVADRLWEALQRHT